MKYARNLTVKVVNGDDSAPLVFKVKMMSTEVALQVVEAIQDKSLSNKMLLCVEFLAEHTRSLDGLEEEDGDPIPFPSDMDERKEILLNLHFDLVSGVMLEVLSKRCPTPAEAGKYTITVN